MEKLIYWLIASSIILVNLSNPREDKINENFSTAKIGLGNFQRNALLGQYQIDSNNLFLP